MLNLNTNIITGTIDGTTIIGDDVFISKLRT